MYRVLYYGKNDDGFCGGADPWILDEFPTIKIAKKNKTILMNEGFRRVYIEEISIEDVDALRTGGV